MAQLLSDRAFDPKLIINFCSAASPGVIYVKYHVSLKNSILFRSLDEQFSGLNPFVFIA
jgi:hypothetical protein